MNHFAFGKRNYLLIAIGMLIVILGFILMSGESSTIEAFNPEIFSARRIRVAPIVCIIGFVLIGVSIVLPSKKTDAISTDAQEEE